MYDDHQPPPQPPIMPLGQPPNPQLPDPRPPPDPTKMRRLGTVY